MSDPVTARSPIVVERVERSRGDGDQVRLRLTGHRLTAATEPEHETLLVVHLHGRRHRFAAEGSALGDPAPGAWEATFNVPDWGVPVEYGQGSLWVGSAAVPVPPVGTKLRGAEPVPTVPAAGPYASPVTMPDLGPVAPPGSPAMPEPPAPTVPPGAYAAVDAGRAGPLADALIRDTVSALHVELEQRSGREAALGVALERARLELAARSSSQAELEAAHVALRAELTRLSEAVAEQQVDFEHRLTDARDRFESELAHEQAKLADGARELDGLRSQLIGAQVDADRARAELAQAQVDADGARAELAQAQMDSDRARTELGEAREQEAGYAHTRERLADANQRLTAAVQSDQLRAQEASSLREQLAAAHISRDAAIAEAGGLRGELARLGSELAVTREHSGAGGGDLGEAQQLLEDARALSAQLRGASAE
jgi:hypothetical protein